MTTSPTGSDTFMDALRASWELARRLRIPDDQANIGFGLVEFIQVADPFTIAEGTIEFEQRALSTQKYRVIANQLLLNPSVSEDLTSWTELIDGTVTATTTHESGLTANTHTELGSKGSAKIDVTGSSASGQASRYQEITAAPSEVWNFEVWCKGTPFTLLNMRLLIEWHDAGHSVLGTANITQVATSSFALIKLENQTAPANTTHVRVFIQGNATASGASGTAYFDQMRAERGPTVMSLRERRILVGFIAART